MDRYMPKMVRTASLEKLRYYKLKEFMPSKVGLKFFKMCIILEPKTAILKPEFGARPLDPPLTAVVKCEH